ncbi:DUF429 domain-containing protein [Luteimonas kalidii]|uniref:DUF429 domain-containing protein n=1 Tax=Luteimonas kalidii TaxID=3042025 RepID=A0ABT6JX59_9GAMM|nr:DUF429 domain-containing protein [Luteimonas kalidii]MDH5835271.1 DUF429 domain-containing protein [Luteimonas kalidii]
MGDRIIAGVDLAWLGTRNPTALAIGRIAGNSVILHSVSGDHYGIGAVIEALRCVPDLHGVAIDAPLVISNEVGMRACERELGCAYGGRKASCHASSLARYPNSDGVVLSNHLERLGFRHLGPTGQRWQLECYPHPALIEIFGLRERLPYKKGTVGQKRVGQIELGRLICSLATSSLLPLHVPDDVRRQVEPDHIQHLVGRELKRNEDMLDAIICMYIGALYQAGQRDQVFGSVDEGYIYVPAFRG